jgi:DNA-binding cell septation regulator SpoVG
MLKKWWFYVIIAVVIIIIAVPLTTIIRLNKSVYDLSFNYAKLEDPLTEIAKKHTYYEAATRTLEIELNQDMINSILKDQLEQMDLGLPEKLTIQEAALVTADKRIYINAKYGAFNLPISAEVIIAYDDNGITVSADNFNLGNKKAPGFVRKQIPADQLKYTIQYADLGLPDVFAIKDIKFSTGNMNVFVELKVDKIKDLAKSYKDEIESVINNIKATAPEAIVTFIDRALQEGLLSDANFDKYVDQILDNEELVNSAVLFAVSSDLNKYAEALDKYQKAISDWAEPIQTVRLDGSLEETVDSILYNDELHEMLAWFIPAATLTEFVDTADTYYTTIKTLDFSGLEEIADSVIYNNDLHEMLSLLIPRDTIREYVNTADKYYATYKVAQGSLERLGKTLEKGDIEGAVKQLIADRQLYQAISLVMGSESADYYIGSISEYYNLYASVTKSLTEALESIPAEDIDRYVNQAVEYAYLIDDGQQHLLDIIAGIDTKAIQEVVAYINQDEGLLKQQLDMLHPDYYAWVMWYVDNLDEIKSQIVASITSADIGAIKQGADIVNDINDDLLHVLDLLKAQKYELAGEAIGNISFDKAEAFIDEKLGG